MSEQKFKVGDTVTYETLDMECYTRGYGLVKETVVTKVVSVCYKLANGEYIEEKQLTLVPSPLPK